MLLNSINVQITYSLQNAELHACSKIGREYLVQTYFMMSL